MTTAARRPRPIVFLTVVLSVLFTTTPTLGATPSASQGDVIAGQFVVTLRPAPHGTETAAASQLVERYGGRVLAVYTAALQGFAVQASESTASAIRADASVAAIEPDQVTYATSTRGGDGSSTRPRAPVAPMAPSVEGGAPSIFVVDSGIRFDHDDFTGRAANGFDAVGDGWNGDDCFGQGTAVADVAGGMRAGLAMSAALISVRVLDCDGRGQLSRLLAGIDWVAAHATAPAVAAIGARTGPSVALDAAVDVVHRGGTIATVAAGDDGRDACESSPGRLAGALTIGAADSNRSRADFSNRGACVDLFAPGVGVKAASNDGPDVTRAWSGTALAAARAAGAASLVASRAPMLTPDEVTASILAHAKIGALGDDGRGSPDRLLDTTFLAPASGAPTSPAPSNTTAPSTVPPTTTVPTGGPTSGSDAVIPPGAEPGSTRSVFGQDVPSGVGMNEFSRGTDGALWWRQLTQSGWSAWQSFGGAMVGDATAAAGPDAVWVFVRGTDSSVYAQRYDGVRWSGWLGLGGTVTTDPVAYATPSGTYLFGRGTDGALYWGRIDTVGAWSGWRFAGGWMAGRTAVAADGSGVHAFVIGSDAGVYTQRFTGDVATGWAALGGGATFDPAAAVDATGVSVIVRGTDGAAYQRRLAGANFGPWQHLGGFLTSSPAMAASGSTIHLFVRGSDLALYWQRIVNGAPQGWQSLGGWLASNPGPAADATGVSVFVNGSDGYLYTRRFEGSWSAWQQLPSVRVASHPFAVSAPIINAAPFPPSVGYGFDACEAPSTATMRTWRLASPYTSIGIYIGGANRSCSNAALNSNAWVNTVVAQGWRLIPIYVGRQAPCAPDYVGSTRLSGDPGTAFWQGVADADDAMSRAQIAGIPPGAPIYFDMEGYDSSDRSCAAAVQSFMSGWSVHLHNRAYRSGLYSSLCSGIVDMARVYDNPAYDRLDAIWIAAWAFNDQNDPRYASYQPTLFGFTGCGAPLSDNMWGYHQRLRQFRGGHNESYGGVTINVDSNAVDGPLYP